MAKEKYLSAHRAFRSSVLLFAATTVSVLQALPQTLSVDQYRGLKKGVDDLTRLDAELAEYEAEVSGEFTSGDQSEEALELSGSASGGEIAAPSSQAEDLGLTPRQRAVARNRGTGDEAASTGVDALGADTGTDPQAALNV